MAGKMNWDRVRKENQSRRQGSEWIGPALELKRDSGSKPSPTKKAAPARIHFGRVSMPGCTCKKTVGFIGLHKKKCPLGKGNQPQSLLPAKPGPTLRQFAECIQKVGQLAAVQDFLSSLQKKVNEDRTTSKADRVTARELIRVLQHDLATNPISNNKVKTT
jgi:hypothetical protein